MKIGLLASIVAHCLAGLIVILLIAPRPMDNPREMDVELATGNPAPPPAPPVAPPPDQAPAAPPPPPPAKTVPEPAAAPDPDPAPPVSEVTNAPPIVAELPAAPKSVPLPPTPEPPPPQPAKPPIQPATQARPPVPKGAATPQSPPPTVRLSDGATTTTVEDKPYNPEYGCKNLQNLGPTYPDGARRRGESGDPRLRVHLDSSGQAFMVEILESSGYRALDDAARNSLLTWRCLPSMLDGTRVPDMFDIRIHFSLG